MLFMEFGISYRFFNIKIIDISKLLKYLFLLSHHFIYKKCIFDKTIFIEMKISGFTFIRNGHSLDYPFVESIKSILPIVDELVVVVGNSDDDTRETVENLDKSKIKIIDTVWDESIRVGGAILAQQTNVALDHITGDWGLYIQGDEVLHEKYQAPLVKSMQTHLNNAEVEGLLFDYKHFYGSYDYVGDSRNWYRKEIRVVRNDPKIRSYRDAQGFRKVDNTKLKVKPANASMYHYGWVRDPQAQIRKNLSFQKLWHDDAWVAENVSANSFDYNLLESLVRFTDTHPAVMAERLQRMQWEFNYDPSKKVLSRKEKFSRIVESLTGWRIGEYKNYKLI